MAARCPRDNEAHLSSASSRTHVRACTVPSGVPSGVKACILIVEQTIGGRHLSVSAAGRRNAGRRMPSQLREHLPQAIVQTFVLQIRRLHLVQHPGNHHRSPSLTRFATLGPSIGPSDRLSLPRPRRRCVEQRGRELPESGRPDRPSPGGGDRVLAGRVAPTKLVCRCFLRWSTPCAPGY